VVTCSAHAGTGIGELWSTIDSYGDALGSSHELSRRRAEQARDWMWAEIRAGLVDRVRNAPHVGTLASRLEADAVAGRLPPPVAADQVLEAFLGETPGEE
jgi:LAO/AO transport system kinase